MIPTRKSQQEDIIRELHERSVAHEVQQFLRLLDLMVEEIKDNLLRCSDAEFLKMQSEGRAYSKLAARLRRDPLARKQGYD